MLLEPSIRFATVLQYMVEHIGPHISVVIQKTIRLGRDDENKKTCAQNFYQRLGVMTSMLVCTHEVKTVILLQQALVSFSGSHVK